MRVIGLGHYSRTGKDTFANLLRNELLFHNRKLRVKKLPLAWKLKQVCHELYAWSGLREAEFYETEEGAPYRDAKLDGLDMTPVELWVAFGTDAVRERVYSRTWIDYVLRNNHECDVMIVPDVRFPNEVDAFREMNALLIKTVREGYGPRDTKADQALMHYTGWDFVAGPTMQALREQAASFGSWIANDCNGFPPGQSQQERSRLLNLQSVRPDKNRMFARLYGAAL